MNKTLLKMALLTSIITPSVMASADNSRQILALLQQMQTSLTQLHSKVDTLETKLSTLEQEKSSVFPKTQQTLATKPTQQAAALSSSITSDTTSDFEEKIEAILGEIQQIYPWFDIICADMNGDPQKVFSLLNKIKGAGTNKAQLRNIRSRMEKGSDLYINDLITPELTSFLDVILSPHSELLQKLISYDSYLFHKNLSSDSLCAENLRDLEIAIRSKLISIDGISLCDYDKAIPGAEDMLIRLMKDGFFNEVKSLHLGSPHLNNLCDLATTMMLQGNFKNIHTFNVYCNNLNKVNKILKKVLEAKKAGKLDKLSIYFYGPYELSHLWLNPELYPSKSNSESQELRKVLKQLGVQTDFSYWR